MNKMKLGFFALGTFGLMVTANAANEVRMLTPEQAEAYEVQAQQTDNQIGDSAPVVESMDPQAWRVSCYARDAFRVTYRVTGYGYPPRIIQREAVRYCQRMSRVPFTCRALGCN